MVSFRHKIPVEQSNGKGILTIVSFIIFNVLDVVFTMNILLPRNANAPFMQALSVILFVFFYPFVSIISPILGIISMISCKIRLYQTYAFFNHLSMVANTLALFLCNLGFTNFEFEFMISGMLLGTKIILA